MRGLLIRGTSLQHTVLVLDKITKKIKGIRLDILTHSHSIAPLKSWYLNGEIISYPYRGAFSIQFFFSPIYNKIKKVHYDIIIVPSENITGIGYENLFTIAFLLFPLQIYLCNKTGEIKQFSKTKIICFFIKKISCYFPAIIITIILLIKWSYSYIRFLIDRKIK